MKGKILVSTALFLSLMLASFSLSPRAAFADDNPNSGTPSSAPTVGSQSISTTVVSSSPTTYATDQPGFTVTLTPAGGWFRYYEGANQYGGYQDLYGFTNQSNMAYQLELDRDPGVEGFWSGLAFSQSFTAVHTEPYFSQYFVDPEDYVNQYNKQQASYDNTYADLYLGYKFPYNEWYNSNMTLYAFAGWRKMVADYVGGTYTQYGCTIGEGCALIGSGSLGGGTGTETFKSMVYGGGWGFEIPITHRWHVSTRLQYGLMPRVLIANDFAAPTVQIIRTTGTDGAAWIDFTYDFSRTMSASIGFNGEYVGVSRSGYNNLGLYYPGGGWSENDLHGKIAFHF